MITLKEACEAMLAGKEVRDDEGAIWTFKTEDGFGFCTKFTKFYDFIPCDPNEVTFTEIIVPKAKYSVDIWLANLPSGGPTDTLDSYLFGTNTISWNNTSYRDSKKYKITVEEVEE